MTAMKRNILVLFVALPICAQQQKRVFLITDAEGVAGICRQEQTEPTNAELQQLLTGEINAAVDGFFAGGATEVFVWDGHDSSRTLSALTIEPRAKLIIGSLSATMLLERKFEAVAFLGQHARANSQGGVMAHSYSSLGIQEMRVNGKPVGEIETRAALAGYFHTPVIFLSGDQMAARQLHEIVPEAETAIVKEGLANYACISNSADAARRAIREGASASMGKLTRIRPYRVEGPVTIEIEYTSRHALGPDAAAQPGTEVVDARTIRFHGKDFLEAWQRSRM